MRSLAATGQSDNSRPRAKCFTSPLLCSHQLYLSCTVFDPRGDIYLTLTMSDPKNPNIEKRSTPQWALYQRENFWKTNTGEVPPFNTGMNVFQNSYNSGIAQLDCGMQIQISLKNSPRRSLRRADGNRSSDCPLSSLIAK